MAVQISDLPFLWIFLSPCIVLNNNTDPFNHLEYFVNLYLCYLQYLDRKCKLRPGKYKVIVMFFFFWRKHLMSSLLNAHAFPFSLMLLIVMDYFCALLLFRSHYKAISWILLSFLCGSGIGMFVSSLCGNDSSMLFLYLTCFVGKFCSECCVVVYPMDFTMVLFILVQVSFIPLLSYVQKIDGINGRRDPCPSFEQNIGCIRS